MYACERQRNAEFGRLNVVQYVRVCVCAFVCSTFYKNRQVGRQASKPRVKASNEKEKEKERMRLSASGRLCVCLCACVFVLQK